jgi:hypothetical protein
MNSKSKSTIIGGFISCFIGGVAIGYLIKKFVKKKKKINNPSILNENEKNSLSQEICTITSDISEKDLVREQLKRNYEFFGDAGMNLIRNSFVVVLGIGGVGR